MKVFSPFLNGDTTTSGSLNLPQHPNTGSILNPRTGSIYQDTTDGILKIYTGTQWQVVGEQTTPAPDVSRDIEYLLVAGGGGAGMLAGGGGGAGGLLSSSLASVESGSSFTVTIGGGGAGATVDGGSGAAGVNSSIAGVTISTITTVAGGGGNHGGTGGSGGSGGGGGYGLGSGPGGSGTAGQGNDGGDGSLGADSTTYPCGGGGGAGTAGSNAASVGLGGDGGDGLQSNITGTGSYYAGGGGGSGGTTPGTGGQGGGGNGGQIFSGTTAQSGTSNTGGGGGGGRTPAGSGGSGVAIFAYESGSFNCAGGIVGDTGNGRKYNQFNTSGTFKVGNIITDFVIPSSILDKAVIHVDAGNFASRGTSTWTDLKGNANGTIGGATLGNNFYYDFDGSNDYINFGDNSATSRTGAFGFDLWIKMDSGHAGSSPVHKETQFSIDIDSSMNIRYADSSVWSYATFGSTASGVSTDTWFHWAVTKNSSNVVTMWINGVSKVSKSFGSAIADNSNSLYLGTYDNSSAFLNGKIAQFRLYNTSLTTQEVIQIYNATKTNFV